ncbi:MAG: 30S ribosomal protein S3 [Patescibacteria group bacterium]|nr:30S ribosomal protein S3 [Patescibacteria group bacterium]
MGHKVNPKIFRIGQSTSWNSKWFASGREYAAKAEQDVKIRRYIMKKLHEAGLDHVEIERARDNMKITIFSSRPGVIIGKGGAGVEDVKNHIVKNILKGKVAKGININIGIKEVTQPQLSAMIVAKNIANELEKRIPFRRAMKRNIEAMMKAGAQGVKVTISGRLDGAEIARREMLSQGKMPLHTLRSDIDYSRTTAETSYGIIGIKVWIYKGEYFGKVEEKKK